jgi:hypothetical protein
MKKYFFLFILTSALFLSSCSDQKGNTEAVNPDETPEMLNESKKDFSMSYNRRKWSSDIIQELFNEAVSKDPILKKLTLKIEAKHKTEIDSLESYLKYLENNNLYWTSVHGYINQMNDSSLIKETREVFDILETTYRKDIEAHVNATDTLDAKKKDLHDHIILMKLLVTQSMMENYQRNELPDIQIINKLIESNDSLINEIKDYSEIKK